ncbi:KCMF1 family protein [Megaselia abdita]
MHFSSSSGLANLSPSGRESVDPIAELLSQLSGVRRTGGSSQQSSQLQQLQMQIQLERQQQASATRQQLDRFPRRNHPMVSTSNVNSSMAEVVSGNGGGGGSTTGGSGNISVSSGPPVGLIGSQSGIGVATMNSRNGGASGEIPLSSSGMHVASFGNANPNLFGGLISGIASGINNIHLANNALSANAPPSNTTGGTSNDSHSQFLLPKFLAPSLADEQLAQIEKDRADRSQFVQALMLSTLSSLKLDGSDQKSDQDDLSDLSDLNKNSNSDMSNNETNSEVTTQTPINNQVDQQQQTNPDDFLEEYSYQQQTPTTPQPQQQHPTQPNYNKKKQQSSTAPATAAAVVLERRGKPPPPSSGQQQQPPPQGRAASKVVSAAKEIPDTR